MRLQNSYYRAACRAVLLEMRDELSDVVSCRVVVISYLGILGQNVTTCYLYQKLIALKTCCAACCLLLFCAITNRSTMS
jgi:hypothetical protein